MMSFDAIRKLFRISEPAGYDRNDLKPLFDAFGALPDVLVDYYLELGRDKRLNHTQDSLVEPCEFEHFKHDDYLIFYCENQRACVWGLKVQDLGTSNPPVYMSHDEKTWRMETETLTDFLTAMACLQAIFALEYTSEEITFITEEEASFVRKNFTKKGVGFSRWADGGIQFYGNHDDCVVMLMKNGSEYDLGYASSDESQHLKNHVMHSVCIMSESACGR